MNEAAPIVQLLLTAQFKQPVQNLTVFDYADLREVYSDHPIHRHVTRAGPMPVLQSPETFAEHETDAPRVQFLTEDLQWEVMFQYDRISVGWNRTSALDHAARYPGFKEVLIRFVQQRQRISKFLLDKGAEGIEVQVGEISYSDAFRLTKPDGSQRRMEEVFANVKSIADFKFQLLNLTYTRIIEGDYPSQAETNITGPGRDSSGSLAAFLRTTVRFVADDEENLETRFDRAHIAAQEIFEMLVKPEAFAILDTQ